MPRRSGALKRLALKPVSAAVNRIDFLKILQKMAHMEPGRTFFEKMGPPVPAYADQEEIIQRTIELTAAQLAQRGDPVDLGEIEEHARSISCKYDLDVHAAGKSSMFTLLAHFFEHQSVDHIFTSADRREQAHIDRLRQAHEDGTGVVYLINHSSHFDEFILILVLEQLGLQLPLFAAGSNMLATPSIERIIMTGSYLIIRKGATRTYLSTLFNYCRALVELGKRQGIFLEAWAGGARTRDGTLRFPRRLVALQGALASEKDVLVQPVVISYSAVPEDLGLSERAGGLTWINGLPYFRNWLRSPHRPIRSFWRAMDNIWGRCYLSFCEPKMLSELDEMRAHDPSDLSRDEFVSLYSMKEIAKSKKVMASQLTARAFLRTRRESESSLVEAARVEVEEMTDYHRRTFGQDPDLEDFIRNNQMADVVEDGLLTLERRKVLSPASFRKKTRKVLAEKALNYYATHGDRRLYSPSAKENLVVVGCGAWGYSLSGMIGRRILDDKGYLNHSLTLFDSREDLVARIIDTRTHPTHFPENMLPKNVFPTSDLTAAFRKSTDVFITSPPEFFEMDLRRLLADALQPINLVIATRGFDHTNHRLPVQIARTLLQDLGRKDVRLFVLSGPITPKKLAEHRGGTMVLAGPPDSTHVLSRLFDSPPFKVHVCDDPLGVQLAGVMAEVYTLWGTYLIRTKEMKGRGQIATFLCETSDEAIRLARAMGGKAETFLANNPAWVSEYVASGLGGPAADFGRQAARSLAKAKQQAREFIQNPSRDRLEEGFSLIGYLGIRSAYITAKKLNIQTPHLRQANRVFWKD